jgi:hypothetical protein
MRTPEQLLEDERRLAICVELERVIAGDLALSERNPQ